jgi:type VI secretion system secreted protein Hcp
MILSRTVKVAAVAAIAAATLAVGTTAIVTAGADSTGTTYYACLKGGKLTQVGVTTPTCNPAATSISLGAQGPAGVAGTNGASGPQGPVGQASVVNLPAASEFPSACPAPPGAPTSQVSPQAFLDIPTIPGESTDATHLNQIDVLSWSTGVSAGTSGASSCPGSRGSVGGGGPSAQQFSIVKRIDKSSPPLMSASSAGTNLGTVVLAVTKKLPDASEGEYLDYTFTDTLVSGVQWVGTNGDEQPEEQVTFSYGGVTISYKQQNSDGTLGSPILSCFDFLSDAAC